MRRIGEGSEMEERKNWFLHLFFCVCFLLIVWAFLSLSGRVFGIFYFATFYPPKESKAFFYDKKKVKKKAKELNWAFWGVSHNVLLLNWCIILARNHCNGLQSALIMLAFSRKTLSSPGGRKVKHTENTPRAQCVRFEKDSWNEKKFIFKHFSFSIPNWSSRIFVCCFCFILQRRVFFLFHSARAPRVMMIFSSNEYLAITFSLC